MIKLAEKNDSSALAELALQLWSNHTLSDLEKLFDELIERDNAAIFIIYDDNKAVGFAQCLLRTEYVKGTKVFPVGYLEGIFVAKEYRKKGYAKELLVACERWAKENNCTEFASDCKIENTTSLKFHQSMGYEETNRIICLRKEI